MKRIYYFSAGVALGAMATRRTRRAKEAARAALAARLTPSAIAADVADAIAEIGNAIGAFAADLRQGAENRRATYRPMVDGATGAIAMLAPDQLAPIRQVDHAPQNGSLDGPDGVGGIATANVTVDADSAADVERNAADAEPAAERSRRTA